MSTKEMWKLLESFAFRFQNRFKLPAYTVSVPRQEIKLMPLSDKSKFKLRLSFFLLLSHILTCFLFLGWIWTQRESVIQNEVVGPVKILIILGEFCGAACALSIHFVISFRPHIGPAILNPITRFKKQVNSKKYIELKNKQEGIMRYT